MERKHSMSRHESLAASRSDVSPRPCGGRGEQVGEKPGFRHPRDLCNHSLKQEFGSWTSDSWPDSDAGLDGMSPTLVLIADICRPHWAFSLGPRVPR